MENACILPIINKPTSANSKPTPTIILKKIVGVVFEANYSIISEMIEWFLYNFLCHFYFVIFYYLPISNAVGCNLASTTNDITMV